MKARNRVRWICVWLLSVAFVSVAPASTAASSNFTYDTAVTYSVNSDGTTNVTEHYTITNNTLRLYLSQLKLTTSTDKISGLGASYDQGGVIPAAATPQATKQGDVVFKNQQVTLTFPKQLYGLGKQWGFTVHYLAKGLVDTRGAAHTVYVPSIQTSEETQNYTVSVSVPQSFGGAHLSGAKATNSQIENGREVYSFGRDELMQHSLALNFGDTNLYHLNFKYPLVNNTLLPKTLTVTLPPDLNNQKIYINSLSPKPVATRLDSDGNVLADYRLGANQHITVTTDVTGEVRYRDYDVSKSGLAKDIPANLIEAYTSPSQYWQTGGQVGSEAAKLTDSKAPVVNNVKAMYQFVINKLSYNSDKIKFNIRQGSAKALAHPDNSVCLEYADLLVAMLRSQKIPARMVTGYGYSGSLKQSDSVSDSLHAWVEAYVPGIGWMTLDPTWGEKFDQFGHSDLDHVAFSVWGAQDHLPTAVMEGDGDQNYQYEHTELTYISKIQQIKPVGAVRAVRYVLLPGVYINQVSVTAPDQVPSDENTVRLGGKDWRFGSLAPHQSIAQTAFGFGMNGLGQARYSLKQDGKELVLAASKEQANWGPFGMLLGLVLVSAAVIFWTTRRKTRLVKNKK